MEGVFSDWISRYIDGKHSSFTVSHKISKQTFVSLDPTFPFPYRTKKELPSYNIDQLKLIPGTWEVPPALAR